MSDNEDENNIYNIKIITNDNKKRKIETSEKQSETYILIQNEELLNQNKQLIIDIKNLNKEKDEIDEWLDKAEKDKHHMKNFIKTIIQLNNINNSIKYNSTMMLKYKNYYINLLIFFQLLLIFLLCCSVSLSISLMIWFFIFFPIPMIYKNESKYIKNNNKYQEEYDLIEKSNNFLDDYIDNL